MVTANVPTYDKGTPQCPCPWPDEPVYIDAGDASFAIKHGGELTRSLVKRAEGRGYLSEPYTICVRCTWVDAGEHQHVRAAWHYDQAPLGWLYHEGVAPTEVELEALGVKTQVPSGVLFPYHGLKHCSPRAAEGGWRYFFRILRDARSGRKYGLQMRV